MTDLTGKTCLITAAAQGIGAASVKAFASAGAKVIATDINAGKLAELEGMDGVTTRLLDVLSDEAVANAASEIGAVDILFNCAGVVHNGSVLDMKDGDLDFAYDLNVKAMVRTVRAFLPGMLEREYGVIINMSSVNAVLAIPAIAAYVVLWAVALSLFWGFSFDDIVEYKTFDRIVFTVDDTTSAPYRCCSTRLCWLNTGTRSSKSSGSARRTNSLGYSEARGHA